MSKSHRSSHASEICRLEWRPSRLLSALMVTLAALAAMSVLASDMPAIAAWPLAIVATCHGVVLARRQLHRPPMAIVWNGHADVVSVDGVPVEEPILQWRGPLAFLTWHRPGGGRGRLSWWPDTLPPAARRELRLAAGLVPATRSPTSMAT